MNDRFNISVVIPCYNSENTILRAIQSVQNQSLSVDEIICVDDCSSDSTVSILDNASLYDKRIKVIKNIRNSGPSFSRNLGISNAKSSVIAFLDSDDYWHVDKLFFQVRLMRYFDIELISCGFSDGLFSRNKLEGFKYLSIDDLLLRNLISTPSVLMKKNNYYFDENMFYAEDYDLWLRMAGDKRKIAFINKSLVFLDKPSFGVSGLSANLHRMELGELKAIYKNSNINQKIIVLPFSILKYIRRLLQVRVRRFLKL